MGAAIVTQVKENTTHPSTTKSNFGVHNLKGYYEQELGILNPLEEKEFETLYRKIENMNLPREWMQEAVSIVKTKRSTKQPFLLFENTIKEWIENQKSSVEKHFNDSFIDNPQEQEIIDYFIEMNQLESISSQAIEIVLEMARTHGIVKTVRNISECNQPLDVSYYKALELRQLLSEERGTLGRLPNPASHSQVYTEDLHDRLEDEKHSTLEPERYTADTQGKEETPQHEAGIVQTEMELEIERKENQGNLGSSPFKQVYFPLQGVHHKMQRLKTQTMNEYEAQIAEQILESHASPMRPKELIQELRKFGIKIPAKSSTSRLYTYMKYSHIVRIGVGKYTVSKSKPL